MMIDRQKVKVSCVSYTNSLPFLYGFENSQIAHKIIVSKDVPSVCAQKLKSGEADVGIVPVGALLDFDYYEVISNFCIGASGPVDSVFIFSEKPIEEVQTLRLDKQSRTSNGLARILLTHYWKKSIRLVEEGDAEAYVEIGDRTFGKKNKEPYAYDLAVEWKKMTGLPFAFALWIATKPMSKGFKTLFDDAIALGLRNRNQVVQDLPQKPHFDYLYYLENNIDYDFDDAKKQAVDLYLKLLKELPSII
jgi:chorismate dehydratase